MSQYYRHLIQQGLLLDTYPNAIAAYSFRKLRDAYTGNCIRVRRSNDNAEQDIGFTSTGVLDTETLLTFVGDNKWTQSQDFSQSVWPKTGTSVTTGATAAPDGTLTGNRLVGTTASTTHAISRSSGTIAIGSNYNISIYVKAGEYFRFRILSSINGAQQRADFNLNTGAITNQLFTNTPNFVSIGNGWWRVDIIQTSGVTSTSNGIIFYILDNTTGAPTFIATGTDGLYIWGAQLTQSSSVQEYRPTTTTLGGSGLITTWYDQSGNGNNAIQTTLSAQLPIVSVTSDTAPIVLTNNGKPSIFNTVNNRWFVFTNTLTSPSSFSTAFVFNRTGTASNQTSFGNNSVGGRPYLFQWASGGNITVAPGTTNITTLATSDTRTGNFISYTSRNSSNLIQGWLNGSVLPSSGTDSTSTTIGALLRYTSSGGVTGYFQEIILWSVNYDGNRTGIEQNINDYYGFY